MKSFLDLVKEQAEGEKHHVFTFGRMNPPTTGHLKLIDKVKKVAKEHKADHTVVTSHSQDTKKNPLSASQKVKHLQRYSPGTHFEASSKEHPTFLHHAAKLHKQGVTHLHMVVGSDRVKEMHDKLHQYNGTHEGALYNFKKIHVHSAGHRDPDAEGTTGMSGTKMREHAKNKDIKSFRKGVPGHVSDEHAKELMHDTRKGMGLHESAYHGLFKAVFVTGGPGSGKDVVIRESIPASSAVELNAVQAYDYLADKQKLSEKTTDFRREAIRNRGPLVINGPADDVRRIDYIREELEELGYDTMMVFVNTTNEASKERNTRLSRMMVESIRHEKWLKSQKNKQHFKESFNSFIEIDNNQTLDLIEEDITDTYKHINSFVSNEFYGDIASDWFINRGKFNLFEGKNVKSSTGFSKIKTSGNRAEGPCDIPADNRAGATGGDDLRGNTFPRKNTNRTYTFRTYSEEAALKVNPVPKESNFSKDKEKDKVNKNKKLVDSPTQSQRMRNVDGIGPQFDTRQQGTVYPMSGLGDVTYREQKEFSRFRKSFKEAIDDPGACDMGVGGTLGGSTNKEPMQSYKDTDRNIGIQIKKKKK